jgi:hypothetical protein
MQIDTLFVKVLEKALQRGWVFEFLYDGEETIGFYTPARARVKEVEVFNLTFSRGGQYATVAFCIQHGTVGDVIFDWSMSINDVMETLMDEIGEERMVL